MLHEDMSIKIKVYNRIGSLLPLFIEQWKFYLEQCWTVWWCKIQIHTASVLGPCDLIWPNVTQHKQHFWGHLCRVIIVLDPWWGSGHLSQSQQPESQRESHGSSRQADGARQGRARPWSFSNISRVCCPCNMKRISCQGLVFVLLFITQDVHLQRKDKGEVDFAVCPSQSRKVNRKDPLHSYEIKAWLLAPCWSFASNCQCWDYSC